MKTVFKPVLKRPRLHHVIIVVYIAAPFVNVLMLRAFLGVPFATIFTHLSAGYGTLATIWLYSAPIVGISLYFVNRFSWYLFIGHSCLILADFILKWATRPAYFLKTVPGLHNVLILAGNLALLAIVAFILQRDFRSPYFQVLNRSWRERKRIPIHHPMDVDGQSFMADDLSPLGCFVREPASQHAAGDKVAVGFASDTLTIACTGEIMRVTQKGIGIRFVGLPAQKKRDIAGMLRKRFSLRQKVDLPCTWNWTSNVRKATILDLSNGGCYVRSDTDGLTEGLDGTLAVKLKDQPLCRNLTGRVVWINGNGRNDKPPGFGFQFHRKQRRFMRYVTVNYGQGLLVR